MYSTPRQIYSQTITKLYLINDRGTPSYGKSLLRRLSRKDFRNQLLCE